MADIAGIKNIDPYVFRADELYNPTHRPKLKDVRQLRARCEELENLVEELSRQRSELEEWIDILESKRSNEEVEAARSYQ